MCLLRYNDNKVIARRRRLWHLEDRSSTLWQNAAILGTAQKGKLIAICKTE